jgi:hypothetical protein
MSQTSHIFAGPGDSVGQVREAIEGELGGRFTYPAEVDEDPYLVHERADVYVGHHDYEDDMVAFSDGSWVPLHSQYPVAIEVRDIDRDAQRQQALAHRIFQALQQSGQWQLVAVDDLQEVTESSGAGR